MQLLSRLALTSQPKRQSPQSAQAPLLQSPLSVQAPLWEHLQSAKEAQLREPQQAVWEHLQALKRPSEAR